MQNHPLLKIYDLLNGFFGDLHWWPGESPFEVIVGAILTQNTAWKNVETVIGRLKAANVLQPDRLSGLEDPVLAEIIRSAGYFRVKTRRLKAFLAFLNGEYEGNLDAMFTEDVRVLRKKLLDVHGIGEETADSILLYGGNKPVFVVDAYTRRIMQRHGYIDGRATYGDIQALFMADLPRRALLFNQYHALLVHTGKTFCARQVPKCDGCPLSLLGKA